MAFFDKLTEVAKNVTDRAADGLETNRLTGDISLEKGIYSAISGNWVNITGRNLRWAKSWKRKQC